MLSMGDAGSLHTDVMHEIRISQSGFNRQEKIDCPDVNVFILTGKAL